MRDIDTVNMSVCLSVFLSVRP